MSTTTTLNVTPKTAADEAQSFAGYKAVEAALQPYIESLNLSIGMAFATPISLSSISRMDSGKSVAKFMTLTQITNL